MKPVLVLALGNPVAGDDAVGAAVATAALADPALAGRADLLLAGTDLFRHAESLAGRRRVILVDAALGTGAAPRVRVLPHPLPDADRTSHAHALDPVGALDVLRSVTPALAGTEFLWLLIEVPEIAARPGLSTAAAALVPEAVAALSRLVLALPPG